jgi:hypothetical protein
MLIPVGGALASHKWRNVQFSEGLLMSRAPWLRAALVVSVVCSSAGPGRAWEEKGIAPAENDGGSEFDPQQAFIKELVLAREARAAAIQKVLLTKTIVDANSVPLEELLERLAKEHKLPIVIDTPALKDEGITLKHPVTVQLADITLRSALALILDPIQLKYVIEDEVFTVTTAAKAAEKMEPRVYDVDKLLIDSDFAGLKGVIKACLQPESWEDIGGSGSIHEFGIAQAIVVRQTEAIHDEIADFLRALERNLNSSHPAKLLPDPIRDAEQAIRGKLTAKCSLSVKEQPLGRVLKGLAETHKFPLWIDRAALSDEGVSYEQLVSLTVRDVRLDSVLTRLLRRLQLTWIIENEVLKVTTVAKGLEKLVTRVYNVRELVTVPAGDLEWPPTRSVVDRMRAARKKGPQGTGGMMGGGGGGMFSLPVRDLRQGFAADPQASEFKTQSDPLRRITREEKSDFTELIELIKTTVQPENWDEIGGPGSVKEFRTFRGLRLITQEEETDFTELIEIIKSTVEPESWDEIGGSGSVHPFARDVIVVRQTPVIHESIRALLYQMFSVKRIRTESEADGAAENPNELTLFVYHFTGDYSYSTKSLAELIPAVVEPESWKPAGGEGTLIIQPTSLVIRQTPDVHKEIVKLLYDVVMQAK